MLDVLEQLEKEDLARLLRDDALWQSVLIDYHPPHVERLWCSWRDYRVSLHRIPVHAQGGALPPAPLATGGARPLGRLRNGLRLGAR